MTEKSIIRSRLLVCTGLAVIGMMPLQAFAADEQAATPNAAPAAAAAPTGDAGDNGVGVIVVTARRDSESIQNVPVSIQAVSGSELQKLAITSVEEVSKLAPGLTLVNAGSSTSVTLRGVTWQPGSGTPATPIYLNEAPFDPGNTIVSLFDVGQIEVLRGPQGTTRGAPSISGAVTISLQKPNLHEYGGYVQGLYGSGDHGDVQGAINIPLIKDILAVRLAANIENSDDNRVYSVNSTIKPKFRDRTYRATVLFQPTDTFSIQAMYQRRKTYSQEYDAVEGTGSPGYAPLGIPANYNGPALTAGDHASVQDQPTYRPQHVDLLAVNANWQVLGHNLAANYGQQWNYSPVVRNATDTLNVIPGFETFTEPSFRGVPKFDTKEIRLSSQRDENRPFDYDIGWFSKYSNGTTLFDLPTYTPGAFGPPFTGLGSSTPNSKYIIDTTLASTIQQKFDSFYGNTRIHIDRNTELSGGAAILRDRVTTITNIQTTAGLIALPTFIPGLCPAGAPASSDYGPAFCELANPASASTQANTNAYHHVIYNFSLSHRFSEQVLAYATTGSSFRSGLASIGNAGLPNDLVVPKPETAKSYEVGVKTDFDHHRLRVNVSVFQLDYKNQLTALSGVNYYNVNLPAASAITTSNLSFYSNVDARVRGAEVEIDAKPVKGLTLGLNLSYSRITSKGGSIPCNGTAALTAANPIDFCAAPKGQVLNTEAPFQGTFNGDYEVPITDAIGGYFRFNVNYKGHNPNYGNDRDANGNFIQTNAYALVDLFAGVSGNRGAWELGVYTKNVFNKIQELSRLDPASPYTAYSSLAPSGYSQITTTLPREVGVSLRYAFGSR